MFSLGIRIYDPLFVYTRDLNSHIENKDVKKNSGLTHAPDDKLRQSTFLRPRSQSQFHEEALPWTVLLHNRHSFQIS